MKNKIFLLLAIFLILSFEVVAQQCVQCEGGSATATNASIIGTNNIASGNSSFAGGKDSEAIAKQSFAFGDKAQAKSLYSIALGKEVTVWGGSSLAIGKNLLTSTTSAMIIGAGFDDNTYRLKNEIPYSLMIGFNSSKPTFFVSESSGSTSTGKIGIGNVTSPTAKLHIKADENYDTASVFIQAFNDNKPAYLWMGNKNFGLQKQNNALAFLSDGDYLFNQGNTGFGTDEPRAKVHVKDGDIFIEDIDHGIVMKSPNGSCWRGTLSDEGQLQFTQVDCDDLMVSTPEVEPTKNAGIRIYPNPTGDRVTVEIPAVQAGARLSIKSSDGKLLAATRLTGTSNPIDIAGYPAGVYVFYIFQNNALLEVKKVVKE